MVATRPRTRLPRGTRRRLTVPSAGAIRADGAAPRVCARPCRDGDPTEPHDRQSEASTATVSKESRRASTATPGSRRPQSPAAAHRRATPRPAAASASATSSTKQPFLERYRTAIVGVVVVAIAAVGVGVVFIGATQAAYTCSIEFDPSPTPRRRPARAPGSGFAEDDMGRSHQVVAGRRRYTVLPAGVAATTTTSRACSARSRRASTGRTTSVGPPNWIHNLEHGAARGPLPRRQPGRDRRRVRRSSSFYNTSRPARSARSRRAASRRSSPGSTTCSSRTPRWSGTGCSALDTGIRRSCSSSTRPSPSGSTPNGAFVAPPEPQCAPPSQSAGARLVGRAERVRRRRQRESVGRAPASPAREPRAHRPPRADRPMRPTGGPNARARSSASG